MSAPQQSDGDPARDAPAPPARSSPTGCPASCPTPTPPRPRSGWTPSTRSSTTPAASRARYLMLSMLERGREQQVGVPACTAPTTSTPSRRSRSRWFPGDEDIERRIRAYIRWNAAIMVHRAQRPGHRRRRAHLHLRLVRVAVRGRLQPLLPRQGPPRRRRPDLLPGPRLPGHLRPRVPRGPADRATSSTASARSCRHPGGGLPSYPHPRLMPDFWEFPTVSMGLGADQRDLPGPVQPLPARPRHQGHHRPARLGVPRRRRDGRAGVARRDRRGRPRGAGQPHLRHQLQPAAPRRPGPRQRQDHPGAGGVLPRRRLERHQGDLGPRVGPAAGRRHRRRAGQPDERHPGRRLPDLQGRVRRVRPRALLRPRPAHAASWSSTCPTRRSGASSAAATTTASCTRRTRRRWSTPASRR